MIKPLWSDERIESEADGLPLEHHPFQYCVEFAKRIRDEYEAKRNAQVERIADLEQRLLERTEELEKLQEKYRSLGAAFIRSESALAEMDDNDE